MWSGLECSSDEFVFIGAEEAEGGSIGDIKLRTLDREWETFPIIHGNKTRGHMLRIRIKRLRGDLKKNISIQRVSVNGKTLPE